MKVLPIDAAASMPPAAARNEPELNLVPTPPAAERARQLMLQAKAVSLEHLKGLEDALAQARILAEAVVQGGDLYGPGLHEFARRLAEELEWREKTLEALTERQRTAARG